MILDVKTIYETGGNEMDISILNLIIGFTAAFIAGLFACKWMISLVKHAKLKYFAYYCFAVGATVVIYIII